MPHTAFSAPVRVGFASLRSNPLRTFLSTLGVIMGVASLVAVLAVGDGVEKFARSAIEKTTDLQTIVVASRTTDVVDGVEVPRESVFHFGLGTRDSLAAALGGKARVSIRDARAAMVSGGAITVQRAALVFGTVPDAEERLNPTYLAGLWRHGSDAPRYRGADPRGTDLVEHSCVGSDRRDRRARVRELPGGQGVAVVTDRCDTARIGREDVRT